MEQICPALNYFMVQVLRSGLSLSSRTRSNKYPTVNYYKPIWVALRSKAQVCSCLTAGIAGSIPLSARMLSLVFVMCCVRSGLLRGAGHTFTGILPGVYVCLIIRWLEL